MVCQAISYFAFICTASYEKEKCILVKTDKVCWTDLENRCEEEEMRSIRWKGKE